MLEIITIEIKIIILNKKITEWSAIKFLSHLRCTINWSAHEMMVLFTSACGKDSDEPACTHGLARAFASRINEECKLKKTPNNFKTSSHSG